MDGEISAVLRSGIFTIITALLTCLPWLTVETVVGYVLGIIAGVVCMVLFVLIKRLIKRHINKISFRYLHYDENNGLTVCTMKGNDILKVAGVTVGNNVDLVSIKVPKDRVAEYLQLLGIDASSDGVICIDQQGDRG